MKYPHQIDKQTLLIATGTYGRCVSSADGDFTSVKYKSDTVADGDCTFDILLNGTTIYGSPTDRPKILDGDQEVILVFADLPLSVSAVEMDTLEFVAVLAGGSIGNALYTHLMIESADASVGSGSGSITFDDGGPDEDGFFIFDEGTI